MPELQRGSTSTSVIDVLDHILDKGIVIDAWMRVSVVGIDLLTMEARVVVASIETYLNRADAFAQTALAFTSLNRPIFWQQPPTRLSPKRGPVAANLRAQKR
jgi:gas vesicle structural protein